MGKSKKLILNTLIFGIGNLGSKLILFTLVPIYTFYLSTSQYGYTDLITTIISLVIPTISLSIYEAVLRFVLDREKNNYLEVFNTGLVILISSSLIVLISGFIINYFLKVDYTIVITLLIVFQMLNVFLTQYIKGLQKNIVFAINGLLLALLTVIFSVIMFNILSDNVFAYFISQLLAYIISLIFLIIFGKLINDTNFRLFNLTLLKKMIIFSLPLIPNQLMWWVMNVSDRYFIMYFLGLSSNGLYAVATKIPTLLSIVSSVFMQAWQISAIEEKNSIDKNNFYSSVFNNLSAILLLIISLVFCILKSVVTLFLDVEYDSVWRYVPFLMLSLLLSNYAMFYGMNYLANLKTTGIFKTSIYGAVVNFILNIILIPIFGINGASIATLFSFFVVWIVRMRETRDFVKILVDWKSLLISIVVLLVQIIFLYKDLVFINYLLFVTLIFFNLKYIKGWFSFLVVRTKKNIKKV